MLPSTLTFEEVWNDSELRAKLKNFLMEEKLDSCYQSLILCERIDEWCKLQDTSQQYREAQKIHQDFKETALELSYVEMIDDILSVCSTEFFSIKAFSKMQTTIFKNFKKQYFKDFLIYHQRTGLIDEESSDGESSAHAVFTNEFSEFLMEDDRVQEIVADLLCSLKPKEHPVNVITSYKNCYSGRDLITWLSSHLSCTREEAISTFDHIQRKVNLMKNVKSIKPVESIMDSPRTLYRTRRRVLIVGGGFGGIVAARKLQDEFDVTLVTPTKHFEYMPDHPHLILDPEYLRQICYDYKKCLTRTRIIYDKVDHVALDHVTLHSNEQTIDFDFLIVSTGRKSKKHIPIDPGCVVIDPYVSHSAIANYPALKRAKKILVVGAGPMGTEITAECALNFPNTLIVLMTSQAEILTTTPLKARRDSWFALIKNYKNVNIMTKCAVKNIRPSSVEYEQNNRLNVANDVDVVILCTGTIPNSELFERYLPHALDANTNQVVVDQHFRVRQGTLVVYKSENKLFAIGDVIHSDEPKASNLAMQHAKMVSKVIKAIESGEKLPRYECNNSPVRFELGNNNSVIVNKDVVVTNPIRKLSMTKKTSNKNLFKI